MGKPPGGARRAPTGNNPNNNSTGASNGNSNTTVGGANIANNGKKLPSNNNNNINNVTNNNSTNSGKSRRRKAYTRGRGRNGTNNTNNSNKSSGNKSKTPPPLQLPHAKITIRKIQNVEKFGSKAKMENFIRCLCGDSLSPTNQGSSNTSNTTNPTNTNVYIKLDEYSLTRCCTDIVREPNIEEEKLDKDKGSQATVSSEEKKVVASTEQMNTAEPDKSATTTSLMNQQSHEDKRVTVTARVLYVTPPRQSRRRGILTGVVYLVLYPPDPTKVVPINITSTTIAPDTNNDAEGSNIIPSTSTTSTTTTTITTQPILLVGQERSKAVATARITLQNAQQYLSSQADNQVGTLGDCVVELSPSQKTWKDLSANANNTIKSTSGSKRSDRGDRYENTICNTDDYKKFLENISKDKEERANRPKPLPGGGEIDLSASNSNNPLPPSGSGISSLDNNNQKNDTLAAANQSNIPLSALAQHLKNKKKEQKAKQLAKRSGTSSATASSSILTPKKKLALGAVKLLEKTNQKKNKIGNSSNVSGTADKKESSTKKTSSAARKEKKRRKEKKNAKGSTNKIVTPILMKNPSPLAVLSASGADNSQTSNKPAQNQTGGKGRKNKGNRKQHTTLPKSGNASGSGGHGGSGGGMTNQP